MWSGTVRVRAGILELNGTIGTAALHAHRTVQVVIARAGELVLADAHGTVRRARAALIPPHREHAIVAGAPDGTLVLVDPELAAGQRLIDLTAADIDSWIRVATMVMDDPKWFRDGRFQGIADSGLARHRHPAVTRAVALSRTRLDSGPLRLSDVARAVDLSESRLSHLFTAELGLPFRAYIRWLRILRAIDLVAAGHTLTAAAHGAGFADSSHLNRVCHRMFGIAPSDFRGVRWIVEPIP